MDKAYKLLLDQEQKKRALDVIQAGKEYVEHTVSIYSAAVFTGSISTPWAPCRRVNVHADIATPAWPDCSCGLHSFAVAVALRIVCLKLAFTPSAEGAWPGHCTYLFPQQSRVWKVLPVLGAVPRSESGTVEPPCYCLALDCYPCLCERAETGA